MYSSNNFIGSTLIEAGPIFGWRSTSVRLNSLQILRFEPTDKDIANNLINPEMLSKYFDILMEWVKDSVNFSLNRKLVTLLKANILAVPTGKSISNYAYSLSLTIK